MRQSKTTHQSDETRTETRKVRVALLDDHTLIRQSMKWTMERFGFSCVAEAGGGAEFLSLCKETRPDLVISDLKLPDNSAIATIKAVLEALPTVKVLVSSAAENSRAFDEAIEAGAHGYVHKANCVDMLQNAIESVMAGCKFLGALPQNLHADLGAHLAPREIDVLKLVAEGLSTKQVADQLSISVRTADHYRTRLMQKLRLHDAVSLTRYAIKAGFASLN